MGRKFYISGFKGDDQFVDHALEVREQGVEREGWDQTGSKAQVVGRKSRVVAQDAAIGLDTEDVHFAGDRAVTRAEVPVFEGGRPTGDIDQIIDRYSDGGKFLGSYTVRWEKTGEGRHTIARNRRIFY